MIKSENEILNLIKQGFKEAFNVDPSQVTEHTTPEDIPGWDSLGHTLLTGSLEAIFDVTFDIDELMAMEDVAAIIKVLVKKFSQ